MRLFATKSPDGQERLRRRVVSDPVTGCWNWVGATSGPSPDSKLRYGKIGVGSRKDGTRTVIKAHRYAYEAFVGPIPDGMWVCHKCDNALCCNPDHLYLGTVRENTRDRVARGRGSAKYKLTVEQLQMIRASDAPSSDLAKALGMNRCHINDIRRGKYCKRLGIEFPVTLTELPADSDERRE